MSSIRHVLEARTLPLMAVVPLTAVVAVTALVLGAATAQATGTAAGDAPRVWHVAVGAAGDCAEVPCGSIDAAYQRAAPGDVVEVAAGTYPDQVLAPRVVDGPTIVVRPEPGAAVTLGAVEVYGQGVTVSGMVVGPLTLGESAERAGFDDVTVVAPDRQALTLRRGSRDVFVTRSRLLGGADHDRIQDQGAIDALLEGNLVGGTTLSPGSKAHVDCLQVLAADGLVVRGNTFFACAAQTVLVQDSFGWGVQRVHFERNVIQDCGSRGPACSAVFAVHLGTPGITWVHNTVAGAVLVLAGAPQTMRGNIFGALLFDWSDLERLCFGSTVVDNLLTTNCPPDVLNRAPNRGNVVGTATFVDDPTARPGPEGPDLHLQAGSAGIDAGRFGTVSEGGPDDAATHEPDDPHGSGASPIDIDGQTLLGRADTGADEWVPVANGALTP